MYHRKDLFVKRKIQRLLSGVDCLCKEKTYQRGSETTRFRQTGRSWFK